MFLTDIRLIIFISGQSAIPTQPFAQTVQPLLHYPPPPWTPRCLAIFIFLHQENNFPHQHHQVPLKVHPAPALVRVQGTLMVPHGQALIAQIAIMHFMLLLATSNASMQMMFGHSTLRRRDFTFAYFVCQYSCILFHLFIFSDMFIEKSMHLTHNIWLHGMGRTPAPPSAEITCVNHIRVPGLLPVINLALISQPRVHRIPFGIIESSTTKHQVQTIQRIFESTLLLKPSLMQLSTL